MMTTVECAKDTVDGYPTHVTTTLFDVIAALQRAGVDDQAVVPILEHMIMNGHIRFSSDRVHSN